jgi:histidine triad (HIT) family protein
MSNPVSMSEKRFSEKIRDREIPTEFLYEDDEVMAFYDIAPIAPVHVLIVPKKVIVSIAEMEDGDERSWDRCFWWPGMLLGT